MKTFYIFLFGAGIFFSGSCKKFMQIAPPVDKISTVSVFQDSAGATSAIVDLYANIELSNIETNLTQCAGLCADELGYTSTNTDYSSFLNNTIAVDNSIVSAEWTSLYQDLYDANLSIEKLSQSTSLDTVYKNQLLGEAEFIRSLLNFYLVNLWGNIPLQTTSNYLINQSASRNPAASIYAQIITDLSDAVNKLQVTYISADRVRANKYTAEALLARVYLYTGDWVDAEKYAGLVIGSGIYTLADPASCFLKESPETILQLYPVLPSYNNFTAHFMIPASPTSLPRFPLTTDLYNAFERGDLRVVNWTDSAIVKNAVYYYAYKYKVRTGTNTDATEYPILFRLAEQYLIRAEARAKQNNLPSANEDINTVRKRAGLVSISPIDQDSVLLAISRERRSELFAEQGNRWFDLKRTGAANTVLGSYKGGLWNPNAMLWPIPINELSLNNTLVQNPGY